jgi:phosphocarrier protein HPr
MQGSCEAAVTLTGDLHARPAGTLAVAAAGFAAAIELQADGGSKVDAKSVLAVMGMGATSGQRVLVRATGPDAAQAVAALTAILAEASHVDR